MKTNRKLFLAMLFVFVVTALVVAVPTVAHAAALPGVAAEAGTDADFWSSLLQQMLLAILPVVATAITTLIIQKIKQIQKQIGSDKMTWISWACQIAVNAAEQAGAAKLIKDKKTYALDLAERWLKEQKITVDLGLLSDAIEAAVKTEINKSPAQ